MGVCEEAVQAVLPRIRALTATYRSGWQAPAETHIGAVLADTILQAGLNYRTVVAPRVERIKRQYPEASITTVFLELLDRVGPREVLQWRHNEKPQRLLDLTWLLAREGVETCAGLRSWLSGAANVERLLAVRGIGLKTVDYLGLLVGRSTIAVDRHILSFLRREGVQVSGYAEAQDLLVECAARARVDTAFLDHAIWLTMSTSRKETVESQCLSSCARGDLASAGHLAC